MAVSSQANTDVAGALADRTTPLIRDRWYVAALSSQIDRTLRDRWILDENVVLFRREDGTPVALQNRCAHRSYPLAKSTLAGDVITCGYHGIEYDAQGRCVGIPCQDIIPKTFSIQSYPLVERAPFVWIWIGDAAAADPATIPPELDFFADPGWETAIHGYFAIECNYLAMHENLLDLTHFPFLHGDKAGSVAYAKSPFDVAVHGDQVSITRIMRNGLLASQRAKNIGVDPAQPVDQTSDTWFVSPALNIGHSIIEPLGGALAGRQLRGEIVHALTPASQFSTHYFWVSARNFAVGDARVNEIGLRRSAETFSEDVVALEMIESLQAREQRPGFREASVRGDRAGLEMRRIIARMASSRPD